MSLLSARIKNRRIELAISQEELAYQVGTSQNAISKYENDKASPSAAVIVEIARVLETTTDFLYGLTDIADRPLRSTSDLDSYELQVLQILRSKRPEDRLKFLRILEAV